MARKITHFIAVWDCQGLESLHNVSKLAQTRTQWEKDVVWAKLSETTIPLMPHTIPMNALLLRARHNSHRHYEIYEFNSELSEQEVRSMFETDPQIIADAIRNIGHQIYSDRATPGKIKIV